MADAPPADPEAPLPREVRRNATVLGVAVGVFGLSFGVLATTAGLTVGQACVMSLLVFTGASQFAAVGVVATGGSLATALGSALLLAARNAAYGVAMAPTFAMAPLRRRVVAAQLVIDESTAMATAQEGRRAREEAFWLTGVAMFVFWNAGTLLGAVAGDAIGHPEVWGLDAAFPAGYLALAMPHLRTRAGPGGGRLRRGHRPGADPARPRGRAHRGRRPGHLPRRAVRPPGAGIVSWAAILALGLAAYALKALGLVVLGPRAVEGTFLRLAGLLPAALLPALVVVNTFAGDRRLVLDARAVGLAVAALAVWRKAPFVVVVGGAVAATALDAGSRLGGPADRPLASPAGEGQEAILD